MWVSSICLDQNFQQQCSLHLNSEQQCSLSTSVLVVCLWCKKVVPSAIHEFTDYLVLHCNMSLGKIKLIWVYGCNLSGSNYRGLPCISCGYPPFARGGHLGSLDGSNKSIQVLSAIPNLVPRSIPEVWGSICPLSSFHNWEWHEMTSTESDLGTSRIKDSWLETALEGCPSGWIPCPAAKFPNRNSFNGVPISHPIYPQCKGHWVLVKADMEFIIVESHSSSKIKLSQNHI